MRSKLLSTLLASAVLAGSAPAAAQVLSPYPLVRGNYDQAAAQRHHALERCAASIAQSSATASQPKFDIFGYEHPNNGNLRIHGTATFATSAHAVEFSCDVDSSGNLRRLDLAKAN